MFSLLYGFWEYIFRKEELRVLILGLDKAGKTTLLERLKSLYSDVPGLEIDKILPTVGLNVGRLDISKSQLLFWDLGGQSGLRSIWDKYYADSHGIIFVVDSTSPERQVSQSCTLAPCRAILAPMKGWEESTGCRALGTGSRTRPTLQHSVHLSC